MLADLTHLPWVLTFIALHCCLFGICLQTEALATAAVRAATKLHAALIVVFTVTGRTANLIAKYRPQQPILTVRRPEGTLAARPAGLTGTGQSRS